jgi:DNA-binding response OmpR family regulator
MPIGACQPTRHAPADGRDGEKPAHRDGIDLLRVFAEHPNRVPSRDQAAHADAQPRVSRSTARSTSARPPAAQDRGDPEKPRTIKTVRGAGYISHRNAFVSVRQ